MKQTAAGAAFLLVWIVAVVALSHSPQDVRNYDRNEAMENPCEFMSSGQYSVNC